MDLILHECEQLRVFSTDLTEMFYSFAVSVDRARFNCLPLVCRLGQLAGTRACQLYRRVQPHSSDADQVRGLRAGGARESSGQCGRMASRA